MKSSTARTDVTRSAAIARAFSRPCGVLSTLGALCALSALFVGCTIETIGGQSPPPKTPSAAAAAPAPTATTAPAKPSTGANELTGLHSSVAANVGTVRGLVEAVEQALRDPGLDARSTRAHERASEKAHAARQALQSGKHRLAQGEATEAKRLLAPAIRELSAEAKLPDAVLELLATQADESGKSTAGAMQAIRATGNPSGIESYERAVAAFADAAAGARSGDGSRALRSLVEGSGHLERGTLARWPTLRAP